MATLFDEDPAPEAGRPEAVSGPLAARMRPRTLDEFVGQERVVGPGTLLRRAIEQDQLSSAIFWGPPGCGKSTLAMLIARHTRAHFETFSAVLSGVGEVRKALEAARVRRKATGRRTILFVDEIHRFNKAQQDAFLPHVEDGTIILIGATTENPYFEVNTPLISRSRIFRFEALDDDAIRRLLRAALGDEERGLAGMRAELEPEAEAHLVLVANGDARSALNALEAAVLAAEPGAEGRRRVTLALAEEAVQQRALAYDRDGDQHYDIVSAFIKSMRGSDPDAAVYWLHRMLTAGEDPRFICRRMVIHAAEDVGLADPTALVVATAAAQALEFVGLPEAQIPMTEAAIYIAAAPKSNAVVTAIGRVKEDLKTRPQGPVPIHLRDSHYRGAKHLGHGRGYKYAHDYPGGYVPQEYVPEGAVSGPYYEPTANGNEAAVRERLDAWRRLGGGEGTGERAEELHPSSLIPHPSETAPPREECPEPWKWRMYGEMSAEVEVLEFLHALVRVLKPGLCVETGTHRGISAWHIGRALRENGEGRLVTCEIDGRLCEEARARCTGLPVEVRCESSLELEFEGEIDFLFIDSALSLRVEEVRRFLPQLSRRAVVALHDTAMAVETQPALREFRKALEVTAAERGLALLHLPTPRGLTLLRAHGRPVTGSP